MIHQISSAPCSQCKSTDHRFEIEYNGIWEYCNDCNGMILHMELAFYTMLVQVAILDTIKSAINLDIDSQSAEIQREYYKEYGA